MGSKWKTLVSLCQKEKFDVIAIAGDIFPKDNGIQEQVHFVKSLKKYAAKIKETGAELVFTLGNDDNQLLIPEMKKGNEEGLWHYLELGTVKIGDYEFAGMPYVPDYPFGYKYWCAGESKTHLRIDPQQFCDPLLINAGNNYYEILDYKDYLEDKPKISDMLEDVQKGVSDVSKCIWLIHAPPAKLALDVCSHGAKVGSEAVLDFIEDYQPFITIHGHIHEAPEYNGYKWYHQYGKTLCVQGGQMGIDLNYVVLELDGTKIVSKKHSKYK
jgi:Icc-related predicted phosphoesterase